MTTRTERDRQKALQDKHQMILSQLLKDEDNKYCVDCDAKGPRWASWNLGIFLCIRCAGIHRNLGVHISKVKSVNLDSWTPEQIAMVQEMGNSRARAVYEANVPDHFRRPQSDSGLEAFIRSKYENKKYIAREWVPPKPKVPQYDQEGREVHPKKIPNSKDPVFEEMPKKDKRKPRTGNGDVRLEQPAPVTKPVVATTEQKPPTAVSRPEPQKPQTQTVNLLGLDDPVPTTVSAANDDPFGAFMSSTTPAVTSSAPPASSQPPQSQQQQLVNNTTAATTSNQNLLGGLGDLNACTLSNGETVGQFTDGTEAGAPSVAEDGKKSKESILALFGNSSQQQQQQQMYGVPGGMYMQPGAPAGMYTGPGGMMNGFMQQQQQMPAMGQNMAMPQQMSGITGSGMNQLSMSNAMTMPQMSASYNQLHQPQTNAYSMYNQTGPPPSMGYILPPSSSLNALPHVNSAPGSIYSGPGEMLSGQIQQTQQQMAALSMGGQPAQQQQQQMGGGGGGAHNLNWGGFPQTAGNTMSTNLWQ